MKQAINTRTQEEYDALMKYFEKTKYKWDSGNAPLEKNYWENIGEYCCVRMDQENKSLGYGLLGYFESVNIPVIPYTEFAKANIVKEKRCELGCKIFTGGEIKHHKDCVFYPESMSQMLDDYKALYLEGRELLQECRLQIEYLHGKFKATGTGINVLLKIDQFLTTHKDED